MRIITAGTNHSEPETAIPVKNQDWHCTFAMAIKQGHAELSPSCPLAFSADDAAGDLLAEGDETGAVGVGDQIRPSSHCTS